MGSEKTKYLIYIILSCIVLSCHSNKSDLELTFLNEKLFAYCLGDCNNIETFYSDKYSESLINVVSFKIENHSDHTYFFAPVCPWNLKKGCSFVEPFSGLSLSNLIITNTDGQEAVFGTSFHHPDSFARFNDSLKFDYFKKLGYRPKTGMDLIFRKYVAENSIIIPAGESRYFESYVTIPFNRPSYFQGLETVSIKKDKQYTVSMVFRADTSELKRVLSSSMLKTIKENDYKIFTGELISVNSVPLVIKNKIK